MPSQQLKLRFTEGKDRKPRLILYKLVVCCNAVSNLRFLDGGQTTKLVQDSRLALFLSTFIMSSPARNYEMARQEEDDPMQGRGQEEEEEEEVEAVAGNVPSDDSSEEPDEDEEEERRIREGFIVDEDEEEEQDDEEEERRKRRKRRKKRHHRSRKSMLSEFSLRQLMSFPPLIHRRKRG